MSKELLYLIRSLVVRKKKTKKKQKEKEKRVVVYGTKHAQRNVTVHLILLIKKPHRYLCSLHYYLILFYYYLNVPAKKVLNESCYAMKAYFAFINFFAFVTLAFFMQSCTLIYYN